WSGSFANEVQNQQGFVERRECTNDFSNHFLVRNEGKIKLSSSRTKGKLIKVSVILRCIAATLQIFYWLNRSYSDEPYSKSTLHGVRLEKLWDAIPLLQTYGRRAPSGGQVITSRGAVDTTEAMPAVIVNARYFQDHTATSYLNKLIRHGQLLTE
ncbi:hypothetical protein HID58_033835, partial [Brassica napus]